MKDISSTKNSPHYPVMLDEILRICSPEKGGLFLDCTFGVGGYSDAILSFPNTQVIALDRDLHTQKYAQKIKKKYPNRFNFYNLKFSELNKTINENTKLDFIIFDLGLSSLQITDLKRGFSFNSKGKPDMGMGLNSINAQEILNNFNLKSLRDIIRVFGEEKESFYIAKNIVNERKKKPIETIPDLVNIIKKSKKKNPRKKINISTQTFQAIRIFVNKEISELIEGLIKASQFLKSGGKLIVISFHSIEDKIVKFFFKEYSEIKNSSRYLPNLKTSEKKFHLINKKPILPSRDEILKNPPSRSAKLRCAKKISNNLDFNFFLEKFKYLTEIENLIREI